MAVVDPDCRVRGVERLRVIYSPIVPRRLSSNTHAATVMAAEKAADPVEART
jgi:choline dehydrogenase